MFSVIGRALDFDTEELEVAGSKSAVCNFIF